jgi:hypothetical protein
VCPEESFGPKSLVSFIDETKICNAGQDVEIWVFSKALRIPKILYDRPDSRVGKQDESHKGGKNVANHLRERFEISGR